MEGPSEPAHRHVTRALLRFLSVFFHLGNLEGDSPGGRQISTPERRHHKSRPLWPKLIVWLYAYIHLRLAVILFWQYSYDVNHVLLREYTKRREAASASPAELVNATNPDLWHLDRLIERHRAGHNESRDTLARLGMPWREFHWGCPLAAMILVLVTSVQYIYYIAFTSWLGTLQPFGEDFTRSMLAPGEEAARCRELARSSVKQLRDSSKNFVHNEIERAQAAIAIVKWRTTGAEARRPTLNPVSRDVKKICSHSEVFAQLESHLCACDHMDMMLGSDELLPVNRSQEWLDRKSRQFATLAVSNLIYSFLFDLAGFIWLPALVADLHLETHADWLNFFEIWLLVEISVLSTTSHMSQLNVNTTDQNHYIDWLLARVRTCIDHNDHLFARGAGHALTTTTTTRSPSGESMRAINGNITRVLLEYEIFLAQFRPIQNSMSWVALATSMMSLGCPVLTRLHLPYIELEMRSMGIYFCFIVALFADSVFVPIVRINNQSRLLYARLMSLLCQAIEFSARSGVPSSRSGPPTVVADRHLIWRLRNILIDSSKFTQQFAASILPSIQLTSPILIKLHYWYVLLILSYFCRIKSWSNLLGDRLEDPLNLLSVAPTETKSSQ